MKKIIQLLFVAAFVLGGLTANAQFENGDKLLNVGLNVGGTLGGGIGAGAAYEVGVHDFISVGGEADFVTWSYGSGGYNVKYNFISFGGRANYHFGKHFITNDKLDFYGGLALGYRIANYSSPWSGYSNSYGSGLYIGPQIGARYYFKPNLAALAEAGYTATALKLGLTFKM